MTLRSNLLAGEELDLTKWGAGGEELDLTKWGAGGEELDLIKWWAGGREEGSGGQWKVTPWGSLSHYRLTGLAPHTIETITTHIYITMSFDNIDDEDTKIQVPSSLFKFNLEINCDHDRSSLWNMYAGITLPVALADWIVMKGLVPAVTAVTAVHVLQSPQSSSRDICYSQEEMQRLGVDL